MNLPSIGTKAVHKDDHAKSVGPVWEVTSVQPQLPQPITIMPAKGHKMNMKHPVDFTSKKELTAGEFNENYVQL
jgi:hypothetical protein